MCSGDMERIMKSAWRNLTALALCAAFVLGAAACSSTPPPAPPPPPPPPPTEEELFERMSLEELNDTSPLDPVFFNYDEAEILPEARRILQRNADWLRRWSSTSIMIEGHCDERGTNEYNLSLGDERAAAVRDYLVSLGIPGNRVRTLSKGEEEPFCNDSQEGCWSRNRRGHFLVTAK